MREVREDLITKYIVLKSAEDWAKFTDVDVVIVGAGPSGMTAAKYLAEEGFKVLIIERRLSVGGGIGGGGNLFHKVLVESPAHEILREFNVRYDEVEKGLYVVDAAELEVKLAAGALDAGARFLLGATVEDVVISENPLRVCGVALTWTAIPLSGLHVDPVFIRSRAVVDATGHDAEVLAVVSKKVPELGVSLKGEKSAEASVGERLVVERTGRVAPGLYAAGMAVAKLYGIPRMGPIFGGMLLSGKKVAEVVAKDIREVA